ncbi:hypothetical protein BZA70DRAFT_112781 [Myxozyma melibiosi]|uniref:Ubiquitin carboxyl-terminal hydrolase n=1 Tax=Myxozyma melibiosi TaxID=54550 RepID=A0ABR1FC56_9ASCO
MSTSYTQPVYSRQIAPAPHPQMLPQQPYMVSQFQPGAPSFVPGIRYYDVQQHPPQYYQEWRPAGFPPPLLAPPLPPPPHTLAPAVPAAPIQHMPHHQHHSHPHSHLHSPSHSQQQVLIPQQPPVFFSPQQQQQQQHLHQPPLPHPAPSQEPTLPLLSSLSSSPSVPSPSSPSPSSLPSSSEPLVRRTPWFSDPASPFPSRHGANHPVLLRSRIQQLAKRSISVDNIVSHADEFQIDRSFISPRVRASVEKSLPPSPLHKQISSDISFGTTGEPATYLPPIEIPTVKPKSPAVEPAARPGTPVKESQQSIKPEGTPAKAEAGTHSRTVSSRSWADIVKPPPVKVSTPPATQPASSSTQYTTAAAPSSNSTEPASPSSASSESSRSSDATELELSTASHSSASQSADLFTAPAPALLPRGLVNTGNMCFMNSILQILLYCVPFYSFVDTMGKKLTHRFDSETPILDSLILFIQEFDPKTVNGFNKDSALAEALAASLITASEENSAATPPPQSQMQFGEPFIPEFVYDALRANTLFANMRRGHQEDAEEFLGFLLDGLHEEFMAVAQQLQKKQIMSGITPTNFVEAAIAELKLEESSAGDGWLEVGKKHKIAVTRTVCVPLQSRKVIGFANKIILQTSVSSSPITKLFGGQFRSVIQAARQKPSVTLDPYQRVQLDISDAEIHTIEDALANISQTEVISQYKSKQGEIVEASKQTFFEKLPKVLILHLKRFHFKVDEASGYAYVQKINKTIGYKCELQIPPECISLPHRDEEANYKLFGVVYHHGKSTEGGHYTVDVHYKPRNQWLNFDDVNIKTIRPEGVETEYEDEQTMRRRIVGSGDNGDERTAYLLFYERV